MLKNIEVSSSESVKWIGQGTDSNVYRIDGEVVKFYNPKITIGVLRRYKELTDYAALMLENHPFSVTFSSKWNDTPQAKGQFIVNRIGAIEQTPNGITVAKSTFIPGPRLSDAHKGDKRWNSLVNELDLAEKLKLTALRKKISFPSYFYNMSDDLSAHIGVPMAAGILLAGMNVKLRIPNPEDNRLILVITDLAASLDLIQGLRSRHPIRSSLLQT